jgi:hypothetical protein
MSDRDSQGKFKKGNKWAVKQGEIRNPGGINGASIHRKLREILEGPEGERYEEGIARAGIKHAVEGNARFWQMVVEIIDGKVPDRIAGHDGGAVKIDDEAMARIQRIVDAADTIPKDETSTG